MIKLKENNQSALTHFKFLEIHFICRINTILSDGKIIKGVSPNKQDINITAELRNFLDYLLNGENLKDLITLLPNAFAKTIEDLNNDYPNLLGNKDSFEILRNIFVDHGYDRIDKYAFIRRIGLDTCPYCNRNYIYYFDTGERKVKPQIDHYYPQHKYPIFAASFYNLIPSCQNCNGLDGKKSTDPITLGIINPYLLTGNDDFLFTYKINDSGILNPLKNKGSVSVILKKNISGNDKAFNLTGHYENHSDHVVELIVKSKLKYSATYRSFLRHLEGFQFSDREIDRMIIGNFSTSEEIHLRPLAKLYQDIALELGLIKKQ